MGTFGCVYEAGQLLASGQLGIHDQSERTSRGGDGELLTVRATSSSVATLMTAPERRGV